MRIYLRLLCIIESIWSIFVICLSMLHLLVLFIDFLYLFSVLRLFYCELTCSPRPESTVPFLKQSQFKITNRWRGARVFYANEDGCSNSRLIKRRMMESPLTVDELHVTSHRPRETRNLAAHGPSPADRFSSSPDPFPTVLR